MDFDKSPLEPGPAHPFLFAATTRLGRTASDADAMRGWTSPRAVADAAKSKEQQSPSEKTPAGLLFRAAPNVNGERDATTAKTSLFNDISNLPSPAPSPSHLTSTPSSNIQEVSRRIASRPLLTPRRRLQASPRLARSTRFSGDSDNDSSEEEEGEQEEDLPVQGNPRKRLKANDPDTPVRHPAEHANNRQDYFGNLMLFPYMISGYIQLFFSVFLIGCMLYIIVKFIQTVNHDLHMKAEEYSTEIIYQVSECSKLYLLNKCDPKTRVMHMEKTCKEWEICMARDPKEIGRLKVGAETLAEILNNLIEPLSYKTMAFGTILLFGSIFLMTTALGSVKTKVGRDPYPHPPSMHPFSGSPYAYHMMSQPPGGGMMFGEHFGSGLGVASGRRSGGLYSTPTRRLGSPRSASSPRKLRDSRAIGYDEANVED